MINSARTIQEFLACACCNGGNSYRIGIACQGYADTWARQNFVGYHNRRETALKDDIDRCIGATE